MQRPITFVTALLATILLAHPSLASCVYILSIDKVSDHPRIMKPNFRAGTQTRCDRMKKRTRRSVVRTRYDDAYALTTIATNRVRHSRVQCTPCNLFKSARAAELTMITMVHPLWVGDISIQHKTQDWDIPHTEYKRRMERWSAFLKKRRAQEARLQNRDPD